MGEKIMKNKTTKKHKITDSILEIENFDKDKFNSLNIDTLLRLLTLMCMPLKTFIPFLVLVNFYLSTEKQM